MFRSKPFRSVRRRRAALHLWVAWLVCGAATALAQDRMAEPTPDTLTYTAVVPEALEETWLEALADYRAALRRGEQVATRALAQQNAESALLLDSLRSQGYYNASVEPLRPENLDQLRYEIDPGQRFIIRRVEWEWPEPLTGNTLEAQSRLRAGQPLVAQTVLDTQTALRREIQSSACFLRVTVRYELNLDRRAHSGTLRFYMDPSPQVTLSGIEITGTETVRPDYATALTGLSPGDCFQRPQLDQARLNLYESNLFARVEEQISEPDENDQVQVTFRVQERFHRTLSLGGGYDTDSGFGISAEWRHRNIASRGEQLTLGSQVSQLRQAVYASLEIPRRSPRRPNITLSTRLERELVQESPAYEWQQGVLLEQRLWPDWTAAIGADLRSTWIREESGVTAFEQWLELPASVVRDTRDDPLDPRSGTRSIVGVTPTFSLSGTQPNYTTLNAGWRGYWSQSQRLTLALSGDATTLSGLGGALNLSDLRSTERLYAGGGGSLRGWPYQEVPPASGGRTRVLASLEQRLRITENWGGVAFTDAAWLSEQTTLSQDDGSYGAGIGIRYFTSFAPLRADIASPLPDWGSAWRFYFSIGQAF